MNSDTVIGTIVVLIGAASYVLLAAAEAGVSAAVRERALKEPAESPVEALRRFYQERQVTLSSLTLARNLATVGVTAVVVFIVLDQTGLKWWVMALTTISIATAFLLLQAFSQRLVAQDPQRWQRMLTPFTSVIRVAFRIPVRLLNAPVGVVMRAWRHDQPREGGAEELLMLSEMEEAGAALQEDERDMIRGVMELEFTNVREVMVPRTDIVAVEVKEGFDRLTQVMVEKGYSRIPVYEDNVDHIIGIAYGKEVMRRLTARETTVDLREVIRPAHFVPESKKVHDMLSEMKQKQISIAIVVDEYGGTAGLVTIEDLVEEIVGELRDEFDIHEQPVELRNENEVIVDARVGIDDLAEMFHVTIQKEDFDSVGGFIVNELGRMPNVGDTVRVNGISLKVLSVAGRRIKKVQVIKVPPEEHKPEAPQANGA